LTATPILGENATATRSPLPTKQELKIFFSHSLKNLERNVLKCVGISPVRQTLIGNVEGITPKARVQWFEKIQKLGSEAR
jgi:hypothetical protein